MVDQKLIDEKCDELLDLLYEDTVNGKVKWVANKKMFGVYTCEYYNADIVIHGKDMMDINEYFLMSKPQINKLYEYIREEEESRRMKKKLTFIENLLKLINKKRKNK